MPWQGKGVSYTQARKRTTCAPDTQTLEVEAGIERDLAALLITSVTLLRQRCRSSVILEAASTWKCSRALCQPQAPAFRGRRSPSPPASRLQSLCPCCRRRKQERQEPHEAMQTPQILEELGRLER